MDNLDIYGQPYGGGENWPKIRQALSDALRGVSYYPYDLIGAPVDIANMVLKPVGLGSEQPILGSDYLRNIAKSLGLAQDPTGSIPETAARIGAGFINPAAGARAVGQIPQQVTRGANITADKLVQMITQNPEATAARVIDETQMPLMQAVMPKEPGFLDISQQTLKQAQDETPKFLTKENNGVLEVTPTGSTGFSQPVFGESQGTGIYPGTVATTRGLGRSVYGVSEQEANRQIQSFLASPDTNRAFQIANEFSTQNLQQPYNLAFNLPPSSLAKQSGIGRAYEIAAEFSDKYPKSTIFDAYLADPEYGPIIQRLGIKNYDDLLEQSYKQLEKETAQQFSALPVKMSFHNGDLNYLDSSEMLRDIVGHNHLTVFRGGDRHEFLNKVDPATGLNSNEQFRAVHDYFGHAIRGNPFGAKGEEIAWASHQQMFSPLARIAMTAETRGQNSFVNYTPINAELIAKMESVRKVQNQAKRVGDQATVDAAAEELRKLGSEWGYAKQASIILPPEFTRVDFAGGMPDYLMDVVGPKFGVEKDITHYGTSPSIQQLDPSMYGTGIKGAELRRMQESFMPVRERSYAYLGQPGDVTPEPGLGPYIYQSKASGLYDPSLDPEKLNLLSRVRNTGSYLTPYGGMADEAQIATDLERLVSQYGYRGLLSPDAATLFRPTPVIRVK